MDTAALNDIVRNGTSIAVVQSVEISIANDTEMKLRAA